MCETLRDAVIIWRDCKQMHKEYLDLEAVTGHERNDKGKKSSCSPASSGI